MDGTYMDFPESATLISTKSLLIVMQATEISRDTLAPQLHSMA